MKIRTIVGLLLIFTLVVGSTGFAAAASDDGQKQVQIPQQAKQQGTMERSQLWDVNPPEDCSGTPGGAGLTDRLRLTWIEI